MLQTLLVCLFATLMTGFQCFRVPMFNAANKLVVRSTNGDSDNLERDMQVFFDKAAEQGAASVRKLTIKERVDRVRKGEQLENEIFAIRERILELENTMMAKTDDEQKEAKFELEDLREQFDTLKYEYRDVVGGGAKDIPIYFGRVPDAFQ